MPPKKLKNQKLRAPKNSVTVEVRGKSLGLRLPKRYFGDRRYFALLLPDNPECRAIAYGRRIEELGEAVEDYCLNKAMNEAVNTPLLDRAMALAYLEE